MRTLGIGLGLLLFLALAPQARTDYLTPDLEKAPVQRLVENLEAAIKKDPKDMKSRFNLARVHGMAYAQKADELQVLKKNPEQGVWFGHEPIHVPFRLEKTTDKEKLKAAQEHLKKAIARFEEVVKAEPANLTARLGLAWSIDQSGDKAKAIESYRGVVKDGWEKEKDLKSASIGWHSVTREAAGYLMPLLDAEKDKEEIATLKERIEKMKRVSRPITPIAIPLRDGLELGDLVDHSARVLFDADGSGDAKPWTWITRDAGWLVFDRAGTGKITSALQLFGNVTFWLFWDNGYQALAALDDNGDGKLTAKELDGLAIWHDGNGNGVSEPGEVKPLAAWRIVELSCRHECVDGKDCVARSRDGVVFKDGKTRTSYDVILRRR